MLTIREAQMQSLQAARDEAFVSWAVGHLRRTCAAEVDGLSDLDLARRTRIGLARARRAGFTEAELVAEFLVLMVRRSPNFDEHPAVRAALRRQVPREAVLLLLPGALSEHEWAEIRAQRDDRVWEG